MSFQLPCLRVIRFYDGKLICLQKIIQIKYNQYNRDGDLLGLDDLPPAVLFILEKLSDNFIND